MTIRKTVIVIGIISLVIISGCTTTDIDGNGKIVKSDNGVKLTDLNIGSDGERKCYHTYVGDLTNTMNRTIDDIEIFVTVYNEENQVLSNFTVKFSELKPNNTVELHVENGPEINGCWSSLEATDYSINVSHDG